MKDPRRFNKVLIFCMFFSSLLWACRKETDSLYTASTNDGKVTLAIRISPVNTRIGENSDYFDSEKIKSLRLILVSTDNKTNLDTIEFNNYIQVENGVPSSEFRYDYMWRTKPGNKKFYIIANEESVEEVTVTTDSGSDYLSGTLSDLLNSFSSGKPVGNLDDTMNSISFTPSFTDMETDVFLPYSSVYDGIIVEDRDFKEISMFIVPAATKFIFNFTNNRPYDVKVSDISINFTNSESYLLGHVNVTDFYKELNENELYWVDWLAQISELSQNYTDFYPNINFNSRYGWISDYEIPSDYLTPSVLIGENNTFTINKMIITGADTTVPGTYTVGPFYLPESKNFDTLEGIESQDAGNQIIQNYYLNLVCEDMDREGQVPMEFSNMAIENLKALFRNTYVIIDIVFSQGDVEVYAEITEWNRRNIQGWVNEGQTPPPGLTFP